MKKLAVAVAGISALLALAVTTPSFAAENEKATKERTIKGEAKCAKCALKEGDKCQTVIQTENKKKGTTAKYYLANNDVAKEFHSKVCKESKKVTAKGTVKKVDGKNELAATKIEVTE